MSRILITGGNGMLGSELQKHFDQATILNGKNDLDLTNLDLVENYLHKNYFDTIIHTAAYTNLKFNDTNPSKALNLHCNIVDIFNKYSKKLIYISAQGKNFKSVYHQTKLQGELKVGEKENNVIIRTNIYGNGGLIKWAVNELNNGNKINGYTNCIFNPVSVLQLSQLIYENIDNLNGLINVGSNFKISKFDFLKLIAKKNNLNSELIFPKLTKGNLDLTVPLITKSYSFKLQEGIDSLKLNK